MFQKAIFWDYQEDKRGAWIKVHVPKWSLSSKLVADKMNGLIKIDDGRTISSQQRRLIYALFKEIAIHTGNEVQELKEFLKIEFIVDCEKDYFSLSDVDVTTAREFTEYVLAFMFKWDIPMSHKVAVMSREVNNYLYLCLIHRTCSICGRKGADIHHVDSVGAGRDRDKIDHTQHRLIALCREHHTESHAIGWDTFKNKYKTDGINVTEETIKKLKI